METIEVSVSVSHRKPQIPILVLSRFSFQYSFLQCRQKLKMEPALEAKLQCKRSLSSKSDTHTKCPTVRVYSHNLEVYSTTNLSLHIVLLRADMHILTAKRYTKTVRDHRRGKTLLFYVIYHIFGCQDHFKKSRTTCLMLPNAPAFLSSTLSVCWNIHGRYNFVYLQRT